MCAYEDHSLYTSVVRGQDSLFCTQLFDSASSNRASTALILCSSFSHRSHVCCSCLV